MKFKAKTQTSDFLLWTTNKSKCPECKAANHNILYMWNLIAKEAYLKCGKCSYIWDIIELIEH